MPDKLGVLLKISWSLDGGSDGVMGSYWTLEANFHLEEDERHNPLDDKTFLIRFSSRLNWDLIINFVQWMWSLSYTIVSFKNIPITIQVRIYTLPLSPQPIIYWMRYFISVILNDMLYQLCRYCKGLINMTFNNYISMYSCGN